MNKPLVSIVIPTKDSSITIEKCLSSIKNQSYQNIEVIVVDNFSKDNTKDIALKYTTHVFSFGTERSAQRNYGVKMALGSYVAVIDSDMELSKDVIEKCVILIETDSSIKSLVIPEESFGKGFWAQCKKLERSFYVGVEWMEASRFFDRKIYQDLGGYNEQMISGEDWDLSQRFESVGKKGRINEFIYHNEGRLSLTKTLKKKVYYARYIGRYLKSNNHMKGKERQTSIFRRYGLFLSKPARLFKNPIFGIGMLFMKTLEFLAGFIGFITYEKQ